MIELSQDDYDKMSDLVERLRHHVIPLYSENREDGPFLLGSSVLLKVGDRLFLVSAAHVLDFGESNPIFLPTTEGLQRLSGDGVRAVKPQGGRLQDPFDFSCLDISGFSVDPHYVPVDASRIDADQPLSPNAVYMALGYPGSMNRLQRSLPRLKPKHYPFGSVIAEESDYAHLPLSAQSHIAMSFDRSRVRTSNGDVVTAPVPKGMSGGGIWKVYDADSGVLSEPNLTGITTTWYPDDKLFVGTRIALVLEAIGLRFPELRDALPNMESVRGSEMTPPPSAS